MKLFIAASILISSACVTSVFADEASNAASSTETSSDTSTASDQSNASSSGSVDHNRRPRGGAQAKRWFKYGVCVGQYLAQQGVVISAGQQLDSSYAQYIQAAKAACRESMRPSENATPTPAPSATPSVEASPTPSASPSPSPSST